MKCLHKKGIIRVLWFILFTAVLTTGCTPEKRYQVISFFFDGVPDPNKKNEEGQEIAQTDTSQRANVITKQESYLHKPFQEEKCKSCHEEGFSNALKKQIPDLCYSCHENFASKFNSLHGPVASGACQQCHDPHESRYEKLLIRTSRDICFNCHESGMVLKNPIHEKIGDQNCTECHNPHGGGNNGFLLGGTCYKCHGDFNSAYSRLHGPVASSSCEACHDSHSSGSAKHLLRESQKLCFFCHNSELVLKSAAHKKIKANKCTSCHNPHGGDDPYFLLQSLVPPEKRKSPALLIKPEVLDSLSKPVPVNTIDRDTTIEDNEKDNDKR